MLYRSKNGQPKNRINVGYCTCPRMVVEEVRVQTYCVTKAFVNIDMIFGG